VRKASPSLDAPLLERLVATAVLFLPAEQRRPRRHTHRADQIAGIGKEIHRFRQLRRIEREIAPVQRHLAQPLGQRGRFAVALRQLVGTEEEIGQPQANIGGEDVRLQLNP
jgi:hypothetical protein